MSPSCQEICRFALMRDNTGIDVNPMDRARIERLMAGRSTPSKVAGRADIVLATSDRVGTGAIMRRTGKANPTVWRWQERYLEAGVEGLLRDETRPARKKPLTPENVSLVTNAIGRIRTAEPSEQNEIAGVDL